MRTERRSGRLPLTTGAAARLSGALLFLTGVVGVALPGTASAGSLRPATPREPAAAFTGSATLHPHNITTVADPAANISPAQAPQNFESSAYCRVGGPIDDSSTCTNAALADINYAHAQEGVPAITLPANWYSLTPPQQMVTIFNLERASHGLPLLLGLGTAYDQQALVGAESAQDPTLNDSPGTVLAGGVLALGDPNVLAADFGWMYDDGWGGPGGTPNIACGGPGAEGCWGHRDAILLTCAAVGESGCNYIGGTGEYPVAVPALNGVVPSYAASFYGTTGPIPPLDYSTPGVKVVTPAVCSTPPSSNTGGYWLAGADGAVYACGNARSYGSLTSMGVLPSSPIVGIAATPDGGGYWLVSSDGGLFAFGDARFFGSMGGHQLDKPIVGMTATPEGGYYEVASDGGLFAFGPGATFDGSMGGKPLNKPVVGIAVDQRGGYYEVATDGGIFNFGAPFHGSTGCLDLTQPIVAMVVSHDLTDAGAATACGFDTPQAPGGYQFVAGDGGVFSFGNTTFAGSLGGQGVTNIVGMATP